ncbi:MAG: hypothetical protein EZS28_017877 [Streblomastix strix]|uniref:Uncharacterized protein n=1 Tax=Streblomastix strix TaxID=222440 RepID=A0A5J4VVL1_9EUKA|nr:MAG: hypothetical protein EZS28_017877 [Streblomastix strix]
MSKNQVKPKSSDLALFVNFDASKFTTKTPVATTVEQQEPKDEIGKFLLSEKQPMLQDIERQLTPRQSVSERTQSVVPNVSQAITGIHISDIDFWAMNILVERNGMASRKEKQCPSILSVTSVPQPNKVLDSIRCQIDKILLSQQALALYNFKIGEGILAHFCEQQSNQQVIDEQEILQEKLASMQRERKNNIVYLIQKMIRNK